MKRTKNCWILKIWTFHKSSRTKEGIWRGLSLKFMLNASVSNDSVQFHVQTRSTSNSKSVTTPLCPNSCFTFQNQCFTFSKSHAWHVAHLVAIFGGEKLKFRNPWNFHQNSQNVYECANGSALISKRYQTHSQRPVWLGRFKTAPNKSLIIR